MGSHPEPELLLGHKAATQDCRGGSSPAVEGSLRGVPARTEYQAGRASSQACPGGSTTRTGVTNRWAGLDRGTVQ